VGVVAAVVVVDAVVQRDEAVLVWGLDEDVEAALECAFPWSRVPAVPLLPFEGGRRVHHEKEDHLGVLVGLGLDLVPVEVRLLLNYPPRLLLEDPKFV